MLCAIDSFNVGTHTEASLGHMELSGTLPTEIGSLPMLERVTCSK